MSRSKGKHDLGSAKEGVEHWWQQRITAIALIPLSIWFVFAMLYLTGADYPAVKQWLQSPLNVTLLLAFLAALLYHAQLGLQVVIEDYVHTEGLKLFAIIATKLLAAVAGIWALVMLLSFI